MRSMLIRLLTAGCAVVPASARNGTMEWTYLANTREVRSLDAAGPTAWFGTSGGLVGLDRAGGKSTRFDPNDFQDANMVTALERDGSEGLWALANGTVWRYDGKAWSRTGRTGSSLLRLKDGTLAVCGPDSVYWYRAGTWSAISHLPEFKNASGAFRSGMAEAKDGTLWVGTTWAGGDVILGSMIERIDATQARVLKRIGGPKDTSLFNWKPMPEIHALASDSNGTIWASNQAALYRLADTGLVPVPSQSLPTAGMYCLLTGRDGGVWVGTAEGVFNWDATRNVPAGPLLTPDPLAGFAVHVLDYDADGRLWAGGPDGLASYALGLWTRLDIPTDPLPSNKILSLTPGPVGEMWIGAAGGLARHSDTGWTVPAFPPRPLSSAGLLPTIFAVDKAGAVWGAAIDIGLFRFLPLGDGRTGVWDWYPGIPAAGSRSMLDLIVDPDDVVWASLNSKVYRFSDGAWTKLPDPPKDAVQSRTRSLASDGKGILWLGTDAALLRFDGSAWHVERDSGMSDLVFDRQGRLWGQGRTGFYRLEAGQWHKLPFPQYREVYLETSHHLFVGPDGHVWFKQRLCGAGFCGDFPATYPATRIGYITQDSIVEVGQVPQPLYANCIAFDGKGYLWLGTANGLMKAARPVTAGIAGGRNRRDAPERSRLILPVSGLRPDAYGSLRDLLGRSQREAVPAKQARVKAKTGNAK